MDQLRVEVPDERSALALVDALRGRHAEIEPHDHDGCEVVIDLDGHPERAVVEPLNAVDDWLVTSRLGGTKVTLDGRSYSLSAAERRAPRRP